MATSYVKDDEGGTFIPASQRPDGSWRKPRRVKDGYVPQEEVPLYESLGKQFSKNKINYPVGMSPEYVAAHKAKVEAQQQGKSLIPGMVVVNEPKKKKKKSKSKNTNALAEELGKASLTDESSTAEPSKTSKQNPKSGKSPATPPARQDGASLLSDSMKRLKNLRKKLREIESLEGKIKSGEIKNPEKEMVDKVARKKEVLDEIKLLESNQ
ncbi:partner of Y14 and mago [Fopius arisanus]|uniref:Partner of Y14 and mago n=1 Tax=Fopius arisanus TaxID=64838 RepID=A0A9R1TEN1_9HYME|nr:PREDICTED: partner of Y14 and mago [Fopius arisanus]